MTINHDPLPTATFDHSNCCFAFIYDNTIFCHNDKSFYNRCFCPRHAYCSSYKPIDSKKFQYIHPIIRLISPQYVPFYIRSFYETNQLSLF